MALIEKETPMNYVAMMVKEYSNRIWVIFHRQTAKGKRD